MTRAKVYLVEWCMSYEPTTLVGIFNTRAQAERVAREFPPPDTHWWYEIHEITLGEIQSDFTEEYEALIRARGEADDDLRHNG